MPDSELLGSYEWTDEHGGGLHKLWVRSAAGGGYVVWYERPRCAPAPGMLPFPLTKAVAGWLGNTLSQLAGKRPTKPK
jgi:hypothetical protein